MSTWQYLVCRVQRQSAGSSIRARAAGSTSLVINGAVVHDNLVLPVRVRAPYGSRSSSFIGGIRIVGPPNQIRGQGAAIE